MQQVSHNNLRAVDEMYRLRYEVFAEHLKWQVGTLHGREIDEFDTNQAIYGYHFSGDNLNGCYRLLPTTEPYMLSTTFRKFFGDSKPLSDPHILESSRFAVRPGLYEQEGPKGVILTTAHLLVDQITYCQENDIHTVVSLTDLRFERVLRMAGLECYRIGSPQQIDTTTAVAGLMKPNDANLSSVKETIIRLNGQDLGDAS